MDGKKNAERLMEFTYWSVNIRRAVDGKKNAERLMEFTYGQ